MTSILHLEDNVLDHRLIVAKLSDLGLDLRITRVDTASAYTKAIEAGGIDLILADFNLPQFDGLSALRLKLKICPQVPFIIVSGAVGELAAIDILKSGATDYVLKDHLDRLPNAVRRAIREEEDRIAREQAEIAVRDARDQAEAANRAKDEFLAVLSHELRTPLTPTLTAIQTMEADPSLPADLLEQVQMIRRNVELEVRLIDDLLNLTRITRGKMELTLRSLDVHETIKQVMAICDPDLHGKSLAVKLQLNATSHHARADAARLHQILWNIVKNAVKFSESGGHVTVHTENDRAGKLKIHVVDTGIGIEPAMMSKIFDAFEQGGKQITREFGGLGLGLAISRALAEQHGGNLSGTSDGIGKGATFTLTLPTITELSPDSRPVNGSPQEFSNLAGVRIMLVEDHIDTARAMGRLLKKWGCIVEVADSVEAGIKLADTYKSDLLISDIGLPDGSGLELMRKLKSREPSIRGIAISGFGMEDDVARSRQAGFVEHLVKPVDLKNLQDAIQRVVSKA